jgi:CRP-like cAMP-binding protein
VAFFESGLHPVTVRALTPVRVLSIERAGFDRLISEQSLTAYKLALNVLLKLGDQVRRLDEWLAQELRDADAAKQREWSAFRAKLYESQEI